MNSLPLATDDAMALITAGVQAPSADNRHIARFEILGDGIRVCVDTRALASCPTHRRLFYEFSFGSIIENIVLRASMLGRACSPRLNARWQADGMVATLEFPSGLPRPEPDPLGSAIFSRHTNRRLYSRKRVPSELRDALRLAAEVHPQVRVHWLDEPPLRSQALRLIRLAESERFRRKALHAELFDAIRFEEGWRHASELGLPPGALEVETGFRMPFRVLRYWAVQRAANALGAASFLGLRAGWLPAWTAPHLGLLSVDRSEPFAFLQAGRAFQRLWLAADQHALALQPMAASVALANQDSGAQWARSSVRERLHSGLAKLADQRHAAMLFRLGFAPPPSVTAGRPPAETRLIGACASSS